jgi:protein TonB
MRKTIVTGLVLAAAVNVGVLLALPLLGGAIETALPARPLLEIRDIEFLPPEVTPDVAVLRDLSPDEEVQVKTVRQPHPPEPQKPPEKPKPAPGAALPDLLKDIDINIEPGALTLEVDLALPETAGLGATGDSGTGEPGKAIPAAKIWSIGEVDRWPVKTHHVDPIYPPWALEQEVEAVVALSLTIGSDGSIRNVRIKHSSGYMDFDEAALQAVRLWRFAPALVGDKAVAVRASQRIRFSLK